MNPITILRKKINLILLFFVLFLLGFYVYQTISVSSGRVSLVNLKKEFLERKNNLNIAVSDLKNRDIFEPALIKEKLKMVEIEKFDYIIVGPSEFALIQNNSNSERQ